MKYCFQLLPHPNFHYREANRILGLNELTILLASLELDAPVVAEETGGADFLTFDVPQLSDEQLERLARHSSLLLLCAQENGMLRPLSANRSAYLPSDLSEVLKYKGKTSAPFTRMMLNCTLALAGVPQDRPPLALDPVCGRGTTLFCALEMGWNAAGVDIDRIDLREAMTYFDRYCAHHHLKRTLKQSAETCGKASVPAAVYTIADTKEHFVANDTRTLRLYNGDTALCDKLMKKTPADVIVGDLPYGVQHAPQMGRKPETFLQLLERALPAWHRALRPGGAMALSYNVLTLPREKLASAIEKAGFTVMTGGVYDQFEHFVEQAVRRDVIFAVRT